ncbi:hypothetical protein N665_0282s0003 [Sinapis alba]|nr:hypothetical protein N665_0282s0003 [Sinapis alba]
MPQKKKKSSSISPTKKKRATAGKKKDSPVKKRKQSPGNRKRDVTAVEKDGGDRDSSSTPTKKARRLNQDQEREPEAPPLHSTSAPTENETDLAETERDTIEPAPQSTAVVTDHETDRHETERPPPTQAEQPSGSSTRSPSPEVEEEEDGEIGSTNAGRPQADEDMAVEPIRPTSFFFKPADYGKSWKLQSRCHQHKFMTTLELLDESEKKWFLEHPQFKHLFHMVCTPTRKVMGLWMLLISTIVTYKSRQAWFAVNGAPIRYSIREHGLISGLYCHHYPENYKSGLSMKFAEKQFRKMFIKKLKNMKKKKKKKKKNHPEEEELKVTVQDVEEKLSRMKLDRTNDRVLDGKSKYGSPIDPFLLQVVDDLELCNTFPWGRFTFDHCIKEIKHILAFECIPVLKAEFREPVPNYEPSCPRMCKWKFTSTGTTGYVLEDLYKALGETKEICSILAPIEREQQVIYVTMEEGCWEDMELLHDGDDDDAIVDGWNKFIVREGGKIFSEDIFMEDTKSRTLEKEQQDVDQLEEEEHEAGHEPERILGGEPVADLENLKEMVMKMMSQMTTMEGKINNKLEDFDRRLKVLEGESIRIENYGDEDNGEKELEEQEEHEDEEAADNGEEAELDGSEKDFEEAEKEHEELEELEEEAADDAEEYTLQVMAAAAEKVE